MAMARSPVPVKASPVPDLACAPNAGGGSSSTRMIPVREPSIRCSAEAVSEVSQVQKKNGCNTSCESGEQTGPGDVRRCCAIARRFSRFWFALVVTVATVVLLVVVDACVTSVWTPGDRNDRCEDSRPDRLLRQPANALSNTAFLFIGVYALLAARVDAQRTQRESDRAQHSFQGTGITAHPAFSVVYGISVVFTGVGSFAYHACGSCPTGGELDIASMFIAAWTLLVLVCYCLLDMWQDSQTLPPKVKCTSDSRADGNAVRACMVIWVVGSGALSQWRALFLRPLGSWMNMYFLLMAFMALIVVLVATLMCMAGRRGAGGERMVRWPYALAIVLPGAIGLCAWAPEELFEYCVSSPLALHALWHVMMAVVLLALFVFLRALKVGQTDLSHWEHALLAAATTSSRR